MFPLSLYFFPIPLSQFETRQKLTHLSVWCAQTPNVSSVIFARVFNDPDLRLYTYDPKSFLSAAPRMFAFPNFGEMYSKMAAEMNAKVHCNRAVKTVKREGRRVIICDDQENQVEFDEVVFACDAETVLKVTENEEDDDDDEGSISDTFYRKRE